MLGIGRYPKFPFMYRPYVFLLHDLGDVGPAAGHFGSFDRFINPGTTIGPLGLIIRGSDQRDQATSMAFSSSVLPISPAVIRAGTAF